MKQLTEIAFFTDDVASMTAFYEKLLGADPAAQSDEMTIFMMGYTKLFIHQTYSRGEGDLPPENHFAFTVDNVDAACKTMQQQGLALEVAPDTYYWGRSAYLRDPDGHLIELTEPAQSDSE